MNTSPSFTTLSLPQSPAPAVHPSPLRRIQVLAIRALAVFPECHLSWSLVVEWCKEHILLQRRWSRDALAIDDEMEREAPLLAECLQNDCPRKRRRVWAAWKETNRRTRALAAELQR
jgi:hypothetical protein